MFQIAIQIRPWTEKSSRTVSHLLHNWLFSGSILDDGIKLTITVRAKVNDSQFDPCQHRIKIPCNKSVLYRCWLIWRVSIIYFYSTTKRVWVQTREPRSAASMMRVSMHQMFHFRRILMQPNLAATDRVCPCKRVWTHLTDALCRGSKMRLHASNVSF